MVIIMSRSCEQLEIDTKDICLLCLRSRIDANCFDSPSTLPWVQGLKQFLRYLKVSPKELFNCSSEFLQSMEIREDINLKISLCSKCSSVTEKFYKLYQDYELIKLQVSDCVQSLHESISKGNESPERVRKYKDQMRPTKSSDLVNASIAANLRNETLKKCSLKLQSETPRVRVALETAVEQCLQPELLGPHGADGPTGCSFNPEIQVREHEYNSVSVRRTPSFENETQSPFANLDIEDNISRVPEPEGSWGMANQDLSEIPQAIAQPKLGINIENRSGRKISYYFNSLRKKSKTNSHRNASVPIVNLTSNNAQRLYRHICKYCETKYSSQLSLRIHMHVAHPEHFISQFLPPTVSLDVSNEKVHEVWKQMFKMSGNKCQICSRTFYQKGNLKYHLVSSHAEQFAIKVLDNIEGRPLTQNIAVADTANKRQVKYCFPCGHCVSVLTSKLSLRNHMAIMHPEHIVYKYFPSHIPLESCRQGVDVVLKQVLHSEYGFTCKFCGKTAARKDHIRLHVVCRHVKQIALEAQQLIGVIPEASASSSTFRNDEDEIDKNSSEDIDENEESMPVEMGFEEERFIDMKFESSPPDMADLDPLDMD